MQNLKERILRSVEKSPSGCWEWADSTNRQGYGQFVVKVAGKQKYHLAHRAAYEQWVGPVPEGLVLDHLCRVRHCCNPDHLEPVTQHVNLLRSPGLTNATKTHCKNGHEFTPENTYLYLNKRESRETRCCRTCQRRHAAAYRSRQKAEAA